MISSLPYPISSPQFAVLIHKSSCDAKIDHEYRRVFRGNSDGEIMRFDISVKYRSRSEIKDQLPYRCRYPQSCNCSTAFNVWREMLKMELHLKTCFGWADTLEVSLWYTSSIRGSLYEGRRVSERRASLRSIWKNPFALQYWSLIFDLSSKSTVPLSTILRKCFDFSGSGWLFKSHKIICSI